MNKNIENILSKLKKGSDEIWGQTLIRKEQADEHKLREKVASIIYENYLDEISKHHSIEVMDVEVREFLSKIPLNGIICDVGGCWGWHWRNIHKLRSDIQVVIIDFSRGNLTHAQNLLNSQIGKNIHLVHGDATALDFENECFDGYWTVQTLQHIPDIDKAIVEAYRVLKPGGVFSNYLLNNAFFIKLAYKAFNKPYVVEGMVGDNFFLRRANKNQVELLASTFNNKITQKYSEILFTPELKMNFMGKEYSIIGKLDSKLTCNTPFFSSIARQHSFHTCKPR